MKNDLARFNRTNKKLQGENKYCEAMEATSLSHKVSENYWNRYQLKDISIEEWAIGSIDVLGYLQC